MPQPSDRKSMADRSWDVRQSLLDLLDKTRTTEAPMGPQEVEDVLDMFKLWTGNLGALHQAHKRISLESRLADSPEVQGQICEQLDDMQEAIQDLLALCSDARVDLGSKTEDAQENPAGIDLLADDLVPDTEYTSSRTEAISILSMASECLKALFRIGILVRKATPRDRFERALQQSGSSFTPQFDINYVEERYPKLASRDSRWLASRLGGANAKRRQFINYVRDHKAKLEVENIMPTADAATTVQSSKATTFVVPGNLSASEFLDSSLEEEDDSVSLISASTAFDNDTSLRLPSLADLGPDGKHFECPICFTLQSFHKEKSWKIHAYRDLKAYVCTTGREECETNMFGDRDSWFSHELEHHHSLYMCKLCGSQYTDKKVLQQHLFDKHGPYSNDEILSVIEHGKLVPSQLKAQDCPFCDDWASILSHRRHQTEGRASSSIQQADILVSLTHFKRHVATHQEQLAIFSAPRLVDDDEEHSHGAVEANSEAVSSQDDNTRMTDEKPQTMEDSTPSQPCVYVTGLPRAVSEDDIENHFRLGGFNGIREVTLIDDFALVQLEDPEDVLLVIASMHGSTLMGARINVLRARLSLDQKTQVVEEHLRMDPSHSDTWPVYDLRTTLQAVQEQAPRDPNNLGYSGQQGNQYQDANVTHQQLQLMASDDNEDQLSQTAIQISPVNSAHDSASIQLEDSQSQQQEQQALEAHADNFDRGRAIGEISAADSHFRTSLLPICEEFIASPPSDPQQRQDQSTHIVTMIRHEVWSTVNFIEAHDDEEVMAMKTEVLEAVDNMLERIHARASSSFDGGWPRKLDELARQPRHGPKYNQLLHLLNDMQNHQSAWPFLVPVNKDEGSYYYDVIKEPMDLSTMEQKLEMDQYTTLEDFTKDATLIFKNCRQYNSESTPYTKSADKLEKFMWSKIKEIPE
ncbi:hypothetical protein INS49_004324 [Diaporthe citri]|uniref:uncharacterized protein n=1 Tax=Diaporthe citri TaxID=83186 RepID=UPI001C806CFD|nr:uncharacterized protein INS49_004324 [Diaporthe citri]KAG6355242.1 hypothetical protein INS49_004324 [Diaporthe citri]